jgi:hypothetical protein
MGGARSESFTRGSQLDNYGRFMLRQLFEPSAAELLARALVRPGDHVLDVASGLTPVARLAAGYPLGLFGPVNETLRSAGLAEPFPRAYETAGAR